MIPVKDIKITEIIQKNQKFLRTKLDSVITDKVSLHFIIWM